jgi:F-type H+-transporting ATPase subunit gamma
MSGNLKLIKRRIKSADNIGQITKAMEMVAASKMKKAQKKAQASKPYSHKVFEVISDLLQDSGPKLHPLLKKPKFNKSPLIIIISTNRGLCGSLNLNLFRYLNRFLYKFEDNSIKFDFITLGKKGLAQVFKMNFNVLADFSEELPFSKSIASVTNLLAQRFIISQNSSVYLAYSDFINALRQEPKIKKILPLAKPEPVSKEDEELKPDFIIEPDPKKIIGFLLPFYLESQVREAVLEAEASEYSARMLAMKNATENANELVDGLTLEYNKVRQQTVTSEISDIVTAKISMEGK